jgi:hypothetical protein
MSEQFIKVPTIDLDQVARVYAAIDADWNASRVWANNSAQAIEHLQELGIKWDRFFQEDSPFYNKMTFADYQRIKADVDGWEKKMRMQMQAGFAALNPKKK